MVARYSQLLGQFPLQYISEMKSILKPYEKVAATAHDYLSDKVPYTEGVWGYAWSRYKTGEIV